MSIVAKRLDESGYLPLGTVLGLCPGDIMLDGDPALRFPKSGTSAPLQFSAHVYCGQTAGWIKMPVGVEVGLGPGHIVLDGDAAPPAWKWTQQPPLSVHVYCGQAVAHLSYC